MTGQQIAINGTVIAPAAIAAETQNHYAADAEAARAEATRALAVHELLLQEARRLELSPAPQSDAEGRRETEEEALIRQLLEDRVAATEPDDAACRNYYEAHPDRFRSPDLFEPAHILLAASPDDTDAYDGAVTRAEAIIAQVLARPNAFADLAREHSACSSAQSGGSLGQVTRGQTAPEFETFLFALEPGQICPVPVKSRYGAHVLRLDRKIEGRTLPYESVRDRITAYLGEGDWRHAVSRFIATLAAQADIEGLDRESLSPASA